MLLAAQSMAVGTVMVPWVCRFADPVMATGYHMLLGGLPLLALSLYREGDVLLERLPQLTGVCSLLLVLSRYRAQASAVLSHWHLKVPSRCTLSARRINEGR
jgi:hypothetical protein